MANYLSQWGDLAAGTNPPTGWTPRGDLSAQSVWTVTAEKYVAHTNPGSAQRFHFLTNDVVDADGGRANCEVLLVAQIQHGSGGIGAAVRGSGATLAYYVHLEGSVLRVALADGTGGSSAHRVTLDTVSVSTAIGEVWAIRFRANGTAIAAKTWKPANLADPTADEPASWDISVTDNTITAAGWVGVGTRVPVTSDITLGVYRQVAIATSGDTAVLSGGGGGSGNPKMHTLTDAFPGPLDSGKWTTSGSASSSTVVDGKLRLSLDATSGFRERWINSVATTWDLTSSHATIKVDGLINATDGMCLLSLRLPGDNNNRLGIFWYGNGNLYTDDFQGGVKSELNVGAYNPTTDAYWRIQESGGNVLWRTSPDGVNWTTRRTKQITGFALTALQVQIYTYGNPPLASPTRFVVDSFNVLPAVSQTYYVSTSGSDSNAGTTEAQPWQTIAKVNAEFSAGTITAGSSVRFAGGQTFTGSLQVTQSGTANAPITLRSYGSGRATIQRSGSNHGLVAAGRSNLVIQDLVFDGLDRTVAQRGLNFSTSTPQSNITLRNLRVRRWGSKGVQFFVSAAVVDGYTNIVVEDCEIDETRGDVAGIYFGGTGPNFTCIRNVTIRRNKMSNGIGDGVIQHSGAGLVVDHINDFLIEDNQISQYGAGGPSTGSGGPTGFWCAMALNGIVRRNEVHHCTTNNGKDGGGIDVDAHSQNILVEKNYTHHNAGAGYMAYHWDAESTSWGPWQNNTFRYNLSVNDGQSAQAAIYVAQHGINASRLDGCDFYGNTIVATGGSKAIVELGTSMTNVRFRNNVFVSRSATRPMVVTGHNTPGVIFAGNNWRAAAGGWLVNWNGTNYNSLSAWRARGSHIEGGTGAPVGTDVDPQLIDPTDERTVGFGNDLKSVLGFTLAITSPMLTAGINLRPLYTLPASDYYGIAIPASGSFVAVGAATTAQQPIIGVSLVDQIRELVAQLEAVIPAIGGDISDMRDQIAGIQVGDLSLAVQKAGALVGSRSALNVIEGDNVTLTVADDAANSRINVTIAAAAGNGGGGGGSVVMSYDGSVYRVVGVDGVLGSTARPDGVVDFHGTANPGLLARPHDRWFYPEVV